MDISLSQAPVWPWVLGVALFIVGFGLSGVRTACEKGRAIHLGMKEFLQSRITFEDVIANTLSDWLTWVALVSAVSAAVVAIRLETLAAKWTKKRQSRRLAEDPFEQGAKQLVSLAFAKNAWLLRLWRWLEVLVAVLWLGFANLLVRWIWWLPVVLLCYVGPAARHYGVGSLLQAPAKAIMTKDTASQAQLCSLSSCGFVTYENF